MFRKACVFALLLLSTTVCAYADQLDSQQIALIRDTAASICNTVKDTKGQKTDVQVQGDVRAQLNGLVGRLAGVGGSATGSLSRDEFEGLTQEATGIALVGDRECRERLFNRMFDKLTATPSGDANTGAARGTTKGAPGAVGLGPGAPTLEYLRNPSLAPMQATTRSGDGSIIGAHEIGLYGCATNGNAIDCYLTETPLTYSRGYRINDLFGAETKLIDDLHLTHNIVRAAWIDGRGDQHRDMELGKNDPAWFLLEFGDADPNINNIRITFRAFTGGEVKGHLLK